MQEKADRRMDFGLLILRSAGFFLLLTFGRQKVIAFLDVIRSGTPLTSFGFTQFLRHLGFPVPGFLAVCAVLNESIIAGFIAVGVVTRVSAAIGAVGMAVAWFVSMRLNEDPSRALIYCIAFATLLITGPGRFSADYWWRARRARRELVPRDDLLRLQKTSGYES